MTEYVGAIDQGTTSSRFIVFDRAGAIISVAQKEHQQIYPEPGWVEHDATEIWNNTVEVIAAALKQNNFGCADFAGVGITNQRETTVLWDRNSGEPLYNALVWQDTRVDDRVISYMQEGGQDRFRALTGLPLASYFSALKIQWILDNVTDARAKAEAGDAIFGTIDSWIIWNLTGGVDGGLHVTDVTNASRTQLMSLSSLEWDDSLLEVFNIPPTVLPRILPSSYVYGLSQIETFPDVPVAGILGDQQAALVGQTCFAEGEVKNTYGTGCFLLMNTGTKPQVSTAGLITTVAYQLRSEEAHYALEGSIAITGALVQWLRDNLGIISSSADIEKLALEVEDNGDVYFVPAFSGLYAPHWKESARGVITGLTRYVNRGHIARAALEATAYQTREVLEAMENDSGIRIKELRVDGGMVANELLMQFQSDILDVQVIRPKISETTALGAAYVAGLAVGYWSDVEELKRNWAEDKRWLSSMDESHRAGLYSSWQKAVTRSFDWVSDN